MIDLLLKKKELIVAAILILLILLIIGAIYIINTGGNGQTLIGLRNLEQKVQEAAKSEEVSNNFAFNSLVSNVADLDNKNLTKEQQFEKVKIINNYLYRAYSETNDHKLYDVYQEFKNFVNINYSDKKFEIKVPCLDPVCADKSSIPPEINSIITEINNSTVSNQVKIEFTKALKTFSYLNDSDSETKIIEFLSLADSIKLDNEFIKAGINIKVYDEIRAYVKKYYPELYNKYSEHSFVEKK